MLDKDYERRCYVLKCIIEYYEIEEEKIDNNLKMFVSNLIQKGKITGDENRKFRKLLFDYKQKIIHIMAISRRFLIDFDKNISFVDFDTIEHIFDDLDEEDTRCTTYNEKTP